MGYAASLYNMMRNAGAAIGISYMTTALVRHEQIHQSYLAERFSVFAAWKMSAAGAQMPGAHAFHFVPQLISGQKQGIGGVYAMIQAQAAMLSFNDIYRTLAIMMLILVPSFIVLRRAEASAGAATH
jgi:DHA2 family multidrug resistance protein